MSVVNLSSEELALIRAALRYWRDEMLPTDSATQQHYFDGASIPTFDAKQIESLIERLHSANESPAPRAKKENP